MALSLSEDILSIVLGAQTAQEVLTSLGNHFNRVFSSRLFELQRRLQTVSKAKKTMNDYLKEMKDLCDQLNSVGNPVTENMKIFAALQGLGRDYEPIKPSIEGAMDSPCHQRSKTLSLVSQALMIVSNPMMLPKHQCLLI